MLLASLLLIVIVRAAVNFMPPETGASLKRSVLLSLTIELVTTDLSFWWPPMPIWPARRMVTLIDELVGVGHAETDGGHVLDDDVADDAAAVADLDRPPFSYALA